MIISMKERSYIIRKKREALLLEYDEEDNIDKQRDLLERIEVLEDELERLTTEQE